MKRIITISGDIGGGKSAVSKSLEKILGYKVIGTGAIQREIAQNRGLTTLELNELSITDTSVDDEIDNFVINLGKTTENIIIDSRLAWHFIPNAFKIFLTVDPLIGAQRVFGDSREQEKNPSLEKTLENNLHRQKLEKERFKHLYNVELRLFNNYDTVIDTSYSPPDSISAKIAELYSLALEGVRFPNLWVNTQRLIPSIHATDFNAAEIDAIRHSIREAGFDYTRPIEITCHGDTFLIMDGNKRAIAAHLETLDLIPCVISQAA